MTPKSKEEDEVQYLEIQPYIRRLAAANDGTISESDMTVENFQNFFTQGTSKTLLSASK